ncbi:hypothetical protein [Dolichospermum circinale]|uniref:hypothetical protein n=1 Tax=Dolichospermum circinale TaxID=109265 RepID=UPI0012DEB189|nr:hypothetical protein [Dolichospermum circinale]
MSVVSCQLSVVSCQLSVVSWQLLVVSFYSISCHLSLITHYLFADPPKTVNPSYISRGFKVVFLILSLSQFDCLNFR